MKEQLITFETAKLAKEKGFDLNGHTNDKCSPSQSLLQKWLRDKFQVHIEIYVQLGFKHWSVSILPMAKRVKAEHPSGFTSYEEALEKGLQEALKLI
jgi:hypothetical protein